MLKAHGIDNVINLTGGLRCVAQNRAPRKFEIWDLKLEIVNLDGKESNEP